MPSVRSEADSVSIASSSAQSAALAPVAGASVVGVTVGVADSVGAAAVVVAGALVALVVGAAAGVDAEQPASRATPEAVTARDRAIRRTVVSRVGALAGFSLGKR